MFLLIILAFILFFDIYFYLGLNSLIKNLSPKRKKAILYSYWGFTLFVIVYMLTALAVPSQHWPLFIRVYVTSVIIIVTVSKIFACIILLIDDIIRIFRWSASAILKSTSKKEQPVENITRVSRLKFLNQFAFILAAVPFISMFYGMFKGAFEYTIRTNRMTFPGLPKAFDGLKIIQISDIHCGSFYSTDPVQRAVNIINSQKADMVFFTGDLVNDFAYEIERFTSILSQIKAPMGVFSVLGNHDYGDYPRWESKEDKIKNFISLVNTQKSMGWDLLRNENRIIEKNGEKIAIVGVENFARTTRNPRYGDLGKALIGTEGIPFKLLLSHDPYHWSEEVIKDYPKVNMTFSGHTHGMQFGVEIPGIKWSPVQYIYEQWAGLYQKGRQYIYVNRGLGFIGYAGRVGILPEITVHEFHQ
ncbi:MAG: metallophosphoesterase [Bacteroidota bacterium]|nr:metallophosphoesterase [Bacteroidota bacterium]